MEFLAAWLVGVFMGLVGAIVAVLVLGRTRPDLLARAGLDLGRLRESPPPTRGLVLAGAAPNAVPVFEADGQAAVNPAHPDLPDAVDPTEETKIERIPHADLRELVRALSTWKPKNHLASGAARWPERRPLARITLTALRLEDDVAAADRSTHLARRALDAQETPRSRYHTDLSST